MPAVRCATVSAGFASRDLRTPRLGDGARIGLVAVGGSGFRANLDHVRTSRVHH